MLVAHIGEHLGYFLCYAWLDHDIHARCPDEMAYQAGLPLDCLWVISEMSNPGDEIRLFSENNITLHKALAFTEEEIESEQTKWSQHIQMLLKTNHEADICHRRLLQMLQQRIIAVDMYGYGSTLAPCETPHTAGK